MRKFTCTVRVPSVLSFLTGFETRQFANESYTEMLKNALIYLSEVVVTAVDKGVIQIYEFENENTTDVKRVGSLNAEKYWMEKEILDLRKICEECHINYYYSDYIRKDVVFYFRNQRASLNNRLGLGSRGTLDVGPKEKLEYLNFFGNFQLIYYPTKFHQEFKSDGNDPFGRAFLDDFKRYNQFDFTSLNYENEMKERQLKAIFLETGNQTDKEVLCSEKYNDVERIYLSFLNTIGCKFLFIKDKAVGVHFKDAINLLENIYPGNSPFELISVCLNINGNTYQVFSHKNEKLEKLTYSKQGKLFLRKNNKVIEADGNTSLKDIFYLGSMDDIMDII